MTDEPDTAELENRIEKLESTIEKMMPSRRDALKMGGAALAGGSLMAGSASAGTNQVGTIGSASQPVDLESEDINNADTVTTQDLVVNGTATGPFGGDLRVCRVFLANDQNISQNNEAKVLFDSEEVDTGNDFNTSTSNYVCPKDGLYLIKLQVSFAGGGDSQERRLFIGSGSQSRPTGKGAALFSAVTDRFDRSTISTVNQYTQGDTIAGYASNIDSSDKVQSGNTLSSHLEVAFLGSL